RAHGASIRPPRSGRSRARIAPPKRPRHNSSDPPHARLLPTRGSDLEPAVTTAVEEKRFAFGRVTHLEHAADDNPVIAGLVLVDRLAVDKGERVAQDGRSTAPPRIRRARETIGAL